MVHHRDGDRVYHCLLRLRDLLSSVELRMLQRVVCMLSQILNNSFDLLLKHLLKMKISNTSLLIIISLKYNLHNHQSGLQQNLNISRHLSDEIKSL